MNVPTTVRARRDRAPGSAGALIGLALPAEDLMAARSVSGGRPGGPRRRWRTSTQRSPRETTTPLPHESRLVTTTAAATVGAKPMGCPRWSVPYRREVLDGRCHTDGRDGGADRAGAASTLLQRHIRAASVAALLTSRLWLLIRGCWCQTEGGAGKSGRRCRCQPLRLSCIIA